MIAMKLGWLALEALCLGSFFCFGSGGAFAMAMVLAAIPVLSFPLHIFLRKKVKLSVSAEPNVHKGSTASFTITLENPTVVPLLRVQCIIVTENQLNRQKQKSAQTTWLAPKGRQQIVLQAGSSYCGRLKISVDKVKLYDGFGIFGVSCKGKGAAYMTAQPDTFEPEIALIPNTGNSDESDVYSEERAGNDLTETYQIREYVPGDSPRQIHWKLSSKFDRLIVREPALPIIQNVLVFWERTGESGDLELLDAQAEIIVSLCKSLLDASIQFTIGWNDTDRNLCVLHEIRDTDELVGVIPRLLRAAGSKEGVSGAELLLQTGEHALCGHMVYLAETPAQGAAELSRYGHVTMLTGGECGMPGARPFDAEHYKEQLTFIEI